MCVLADFQESIAASKIKLLENQYLIHKLAHATAGCAAAEAAGNACRDGAIGAAIGEIVAEKMPIDTSDESILAASKLAAGFAATYVGGDAQAAVNTAEVAVRNNYLTTRQTRQMREALAACSNAVQCTHVLIKYGVIDNAQDAALVAGWTGGMVYGLGETAGDLISLVSSPLETIQALKTLINDPELIYQVGEDVIAEYAERIDIMEQAYEAGTLEGSTAAGAEMGRLTFEIAGLTTGVLGATKGTAKVGAVLSEHAKNAYQKVSERIAGLIADTRQHTVTIPDIEWGGGIQQQGFPYENYVGTTLPDGSKLPDNFKTFDFYDATTGNAISAKTLDTTTAAKINDPRQVYYALKPYIDKAYNFEEYTLDNIPLNSSMISSREIRLGIPESTTNAQREQIARAVQYAQEKNITLTVHQIRL